MSNQQGATHTILGANGAIGRELSPLLRAAGHRVRQAARQPRAEHPEDELVATDLLDAPATAAAVAGSKVAYLLAGLRYDHRVWAAEWPVVMQNAIDACRRHGCRLVFFDNVYAYGRVEGLMTEETPYNPCSRKGEVRARIATTLMEAVAARRAGCDDRSGRGLLRPGAVLSLTHLDVVDRLRAGKTPQWMGDPQGGALIHVHAGRRARAVAALGNAPSAFGQTWHALTSPASR